MLIPLSEVVEQVRSRVPVDSFGRRRYALRARPVGAVKAGQQRLVRGVDLTAQQAAEIRVQYRPQRQPLAPRDDGVPR